jgi:hypothetical protein
VVIRYDEARTITATGSLTSTTTTAAGVKTTTFTSGTGSISFA